MRISPSVANPAAALAEAQNALSEALQLPDTAHAHADGSCDTGCEAGCECEACLSGKEMNHEEGCDCGSCGLAATTAKVMGSEDVQASTGLTLNEPLQSLHWGSKLSLTNKVLNVHFVPAGSPSYLPSGVTTETWNDYEVQQAKLALQTFSDALDLTIQYTDNANDAEFVLHLLSGASSTALMSGALGMMFPPDEPYEGFGFFNRDGYGWDTTANGGLEQGGYGFITLIHEFGHGFGLAHPHDTGGTSSVMPGVSSSMNAGDYDLNQGVFTTMSYYDGWPVTKGQSSSLAHGWQGTPMNLDLAILQQMYGASSSNDGPTTFTLPFGSTVGVDYKAIWDSSGIDQIVNDSSATSTIDLREAPISQAANGAGYVSHIGATYGGITIPANVEIENVTGGTSADDIYGNTLDNVIDARAGNDNIYHGGGSNTYVGGSGNDHVYFPNALNTYTVTAPAGVLTITDGSEGSTIDGSVEYVVFNGQTYSYASVLASTGSNSLPVFTSGTAVDFAENGTGVAYTATASDADADADTLSFTIAGGPDQGAFVLDGDTGELSFTAAPDFEAQASADGDNDYHVDIRVSDGNGGTATQTVTVSVTDVNENAAPTQIDYNGVTYELIPTLRTFADAEQDAYAQGGYLATLTTEAEATAVFNMVDAYFQANPSAYYSSYANDGGLAAYFWAGGGDFSREGEWVWSNGEAFADTYTNWGPGHASHPGEPDNYGGAQDALAVALESWPWLSPPYIGQAGEWNDISATNRLYYVIEFGDDQVIESNGDVDLRTIPWVGYDVVDSGGTPITLTDSRGNPIPATKTLLQAEDDGATGYIAVEESVGRRGDVSHNILRFDGSGRQIGLTSLGTSESALISWEDDFVADLNGDTIIGHTLVEIESVGDVVLSRSTTGGFSINHSGAGEMDLLDSRGRLIQQSTRYQFEHAEENADGGYDVLVNQPRRGVDSYLVRHFDSTGKELPGRATVLGTNDAALVDWEDDFEFNLNGDSAIGHTLEEIESVGDVVLSQSTTGGFSINHNGAGEMDLVDSRGRIIQQSTRYQFEHAEENADGGYDVLVNQPRRGVDSYLVRHFDSTGKELPGRATVLGTNDAALIDWEDDFEFNLNGDSAIGHTLVEIESVGDVVLSQSTTGGFSINHNGAGEMDLVDSRGRIIQQSTGYQFEHAEENADGGYDVLVNQPRRGVDSYQVRHFDSTGQELPGRATVLGTNNAALVDWEDDFEFNLNGDSAIGHTLEEIESVGDVVLSQSTTGGFSINHSGAGEMDLVDTRGRIILQSTRYQFEHAEENADGGYDVLVNQPRRGIDNYQVRHFDSSGEELGRATVLGTNNAALIDWEDDFEFNLNGDSAIGHILEEIESVGDVVLSQSTTGGFSINHSGAGEMDLVDIRGRLILQSTRYQFEHAEENTDGGFDVLVNQPRRGIDNYQVRHFDSSGQELPGRPTFIGRSEDALVSWEDDFEFDLNNDLSIGRTYSGLTDLDVI